MSRQPSSFAKIVRALITAVRMTLRGQVAPAPNSVDGIASDFPQTAVWMKGVIPLLSEIVVESAKHQINLKTLTVHIEGRDWTAETILESVGFHALQEYPHLLRNDREHGGMAMTATNLNDQFRVSRLAAAPNLPDSVRTALEKLAAHLAAAPKQP